MGKLVPSELSAFGSNSDIEIGSGQILHEPVLAPIYLFVRLLTTS
jgi:hypothetical protein